MLYVTLGVKPPPSWTSGRGSGAGGGGASKRASLGPTDTSSLQELLKVSAVAAAAAAAAASSGGGGDSSAAASSAAGSACAAAVAATGTGDPAVAAAAAASVVAGSAGGGGSSAEAGGAAGSTCGATATRDATSAAAAAAAGGSIRGDSGGGTFRRAPTILTEVREMGSQRLFLKIQWVLCWASTILLNFEQQQRNGRATSLWTSTVVCQHGDGTNVANAKPVALMVVLPPTQFSGTAPLRVSNGYLFLVDPVGTGADPSSSFRGENNAAPNI